MGRREIESGAVGVAEARTVKHGVSRLLPYAPPFLIWFGILGLALIGYSQWSPAVPGHNHWAFGLYPLAVVAAHGGGMWLSRKMTKHKDNSEPIVVLAQSTFVWSTMLCVLVGLAGPQSWIISPLWGGIGGCGVLYWTIRRMHLTGDAKASAQAVGGQVGKLVTALNGAKPGAVTVNEHGVITQQLEANRGEQDVSELQEYVKAATSVAGLRPGAGKLIPSTTDAGYAEAKWYPADNLLNKVVWPGPTAFGESIAVPVLVGRRVDFTPIKLYLAADLIESRVQPQWLIMGMSGAGKSEFFRVLMAEVLTRKDVTVWLHDHVKGLQTFAPIIQGLVASKNASDIVVSMQKATGKAMLNAVREVIRLRARWLGAKGFDAWVPGCGLNKLVVYLEEATEIGQLRDLMLLAKEGRSVGVEVFISLQRASHESMDTETRAQLSGNICFGVRNRTDASFGLSERSSDGGASPELWENKNPGAVYVDAPGFSEEEAITEGRMMIASKPEIVESIKRGGAVRRPLEEETDQITIKAAGEFYKNRLPVEAFVVGHPLFAKATGLDLGGASNEHNGESVHVSDTAGLAATSDNGAERTTVGSVQSAPSEDVDADEEDDEMDEEDMIERLQTEHKYPTPPTFAMANTRTPVEELSREECQARVQKYLMEKCRAGNFNVRVPDIEKMTPPIRFKNQWIRNELNRLCGGQADVMGYRLERDAAPGAPTGSYQIVPPVRADA